MQSDVYDGYIYIQTVIISTSKAANQYITIIMEKKLFFV